MFEVAKAQKIDRFEISQLDPLSFQVCCETDGATYEVTNYITDWHCRCPDHILHSTKCEHIKAVKRWLTSFLKEKLCSSEPIAKGPREGHRCSSCGLTDIIRDGYRRTRNGKKQRYKCKRCGYRFTICNSSFYKMEYMPKVVTLALDLYFKGVSLRKITDHLKQFYDVAVHHTTILYWIRKYTKLINDYLDSLMPQLSDTWHVDEMMVKCGGKWRWLWNIMDKDTRFLLVSLLSKGREIRNARKAFAEAKRNLKEKPMQVVTDGLWSYVDAVKKEFFTLRKPRTKHIRLANFEDKVNNNLVERMQGTIRERNKVMRGFNGDKSAQILIDGLKAYYNFLRPHMGLDNKTQAEVAGIDLKLGRNRWLSLIEKCEPELQKV